MAMMERLNELVPRRVTATRSLNLALQGGGAHGAFTWGVLDRLLEDGRLRFRAVSGTSAGAMNAAVLAAGLTQGGPEAARELLERFWQAVSALGRYSPLRSFPLDPGAVGGAESTNHLVLDLLSRLVSPYQFNPLDFNPLKDVLNELINFNSLKKNSEIELYIAATEVATGNVRIFETRELSVDALLASACLPQLHQAVKVGRRHYWDGGYSANPPILPLLRGAHALDTLIVQLNPTKEARVPTSAQEIAARINTMTFHAPFKREIEAITQCRAVAAEGIAWRGGFRRRVRRHRFHLIEAERATRGLGAGSKLTPDWEMLCRLRDSGREAAKYWMGRNFSALGRRATVDLEAKFA